MTNDPNVKTDPHVVYETVRDAVSGDDAPMESEHKVATAALVGATYPIVLIMLLVVGLVVAYFTAWRSSEARDHTTSTSVPEVVK